ncbi:glycosyltransferase [Nitrosomonas sp. Nm58]|uniref:glycosyltransferase n=1 Tax=Nitrosomonas sp. Nm58 TaxID=200126 RepID=UPI000895F3F1|nr:glycosyltransferase [Nitrosomonas sp. Nm58]SDY15126.1 Glycosyltransferase involved in cell wall bisynthesis [Nitrosomonas sp. Nm58]
MVMGTGESLHVAVFLSGLTGGGAQRRSLLLARGFVARGCAVDLIVVHAEGPFRTAVAPGIRLLALEPCASRLPVIRRIKGLWVISSLFALARYLATTRPDVLLATSIPANLAALWGRTLSRTHTPTVITANLNLTKATAKWGALVAKRLRWLIARAYGGAQAVIAISRGVADDLITVTGIPEKRVFSIYNPLDLERVTRQSRETVEHPWLAVGAPPVVLAVGKLKRQKDYPTLVQAFARVRAHREARLVILGEGEERARIERLVKILGVEADVYLPGFVENPFAWMARVSVFVLASAWEGLSNVLLEALACGCTIVSTDCPSGPREILADGAFGHLVPVGDDAALAAAIAAALSAPAQRERSAARAAEFGFDAAVERYLAVLRRVSALRQGD